MTAGHRGTHELASAFLIADQHGSIIAIGTRWPIDKRVPCRGRQSGKRWPSWVTTIMVSCEMPVELRNELIHSAAIIGPAPRKAHRKKESQDPWPERELRPRASFMPGRLTATACSFESGQTHLIQFQTQDDFDGRISNFVCSGRAGPRFLRRSSSQTARRPWKTSRFSSDFIHFSGRNRPAIFFPLSRISPELGLSRPTSVRSRVLLRNGTAQITRVSPRITSKPMPWRNSRSP